MWPSSAIGSIAAINPSDKLIAAVEQEAEPIQDRQWKLFWAASGQERYYDLTETAFKFCFRITPNKSIVTIVAAL
ncbi:MAG: hypothetical protein ACYTFU_07140, partial [Planctomycetota bacterium]